MGPEPGRFLEIKSKIKIKIPYFGFNYTLGNKVKYRALLAISYSKLNAEINVVRDNIGTSFLRSFKKSKVVPLLKFSIVKPITKRQGLTVTAQYHGLSRFKLKSQEVPDAYTEIRLKNSISLGLGYYFSL